jgi:DNA-binding helix-hairpin-helix protein with protein kinase domain
VKTLVITKDRRVIVKSTLKQANTLNSNKKFKGTLVTCPHCHAQVPYRLIAKQIAAKPKFNRNTILKIIKDESPTISGVVASNYFILTGCKLSTRNLLYILKEFEKQGLITTKVSSNGRYGRSTHVTFCQKKEACSK